VACGKYTARGPMRFVSFTEPWVCQHLGFFFSSDKQLGQSRAEVRKPLFFKYARKDSNLQPSVPKTDALSNCATDA
jgi:hypothetical protein